MLKHLIDRPVAVTMAMLVIVVLGCVSLRLLPVSLIPDVDIPYITVQVDAPSLSAREMDESVIAPLRLQLIQVNGLKDIVSEARDGSGTIRLTFSHGDDISYLFIEVNEKIDRSMPSLHGIDRPKVFKASATDIPAFYINMTLADTTGYPDRFLQASRFAEEVIAKRLEQLPQVAMVDISGGVQPEIQIRPDADKLSAAGITLQQFESHIRSADVRLGSLTIRDGEYRYNVKFRSSLTSKEDIEQIYFKAGDRILKVSDVAQVSVCPAKRTGLVRSDGAEALCMAVIKQNDARMADLKKEVDALLLQYYEEPDVKKAAFGHDLTKEDWGRIGGLMTKFMELRYGVPMVSINVTHPLIQELESVTGQLASGDLRARIPKTDVVELIKLTDQVNVMADNLETTMRQNVQDARNLKKAAQILDEVKVSGLFLSGGDTAIHFIDAVKATGAEIGSPPPSPQPCSSTAFLGQMA